MGEGVAMTTGQRLVELSGLSGVTAAQHLMSIGAGGSAGAMLVSRSSLLIGSAMYHLMDGGSPTSLVLWNLVLARRLGRR